MTLQHTTSESLVAFVTSLESRLAILLEAKVGPKSIAGYVPLSLSFRQERAALVPFSQRALYCMLFQEMRLITRSLKPWVVTLPHRTSRVDSLAQESVGQSGFAVDDTMVRRMRRGPFLQGRDQSNGFQATCPLFYCRTGFSTKCQGEGTCRHVPAKLTSNSSEVPRSLLPFPSSKLHRRVASRLPSCPRGSNFCGHFPTGLRPLPTRYWFWCVGFCPQKIILHFAPFSGRIPCQILIQKYSPL